MKPTLHLTSDLVGMKLISIAQKLIEKKIGKVEGQEFIRKALQAENEDSIFVSIKEYCEIQKV